MSLRIELYNNIVGPFSVQPDTIDLDKLDQTLERTQTQGDGIIHEYSLDLRFTKGAKDYLYRCFKEAGGIEAEVIAQIFEYNPNSFKWENIGTGKIKFINYDRGAEDAKTSIEQVGTQRRVINMLDVDVDLEGTITENGSTIPGVEIITLPLHAKSVPYLGHYIYLDSFTFPDEGGIQLQFDWDRAIKDDLGKFSVTNARVAPNTIESIVYTTATPQFEAPYDGEFTFDIRFVYGRWVGSAWSFGDIALRIRKAGEPIGSTNFTVVNMPVGDPGEGYSIGTYQGALNLKKGEQVVIFGSEDSTVHIFGQKRWSYKTDVYVATTASITLFGEQVIDTKLTSTSRVLVMNQGDETENGIYLSGPGAWTRATDSDSADELNNSAVYVVDGSFHKDFAYRQIRTVSVIGTDPIEYEFFTSSNERFQPFPGPEDDEGSYLKVTAKTTYRETTTKAALIFEAFERTLQYYANQEDILKSDFFGRTDRGYAADGPGSKTAVTSGAAIRQLETQTVFLNLQDLFASMRAIHCIGMGFETIAGKQYVRIEPLEHFYNKNSLILDLGVVSKLRSKVSTKHYYNQVEVGFNKLDIQQSNGIDEFIALRKFKNAITQINAKLTLLSKYKASGFEIEDQRRKIDSTKDSKLDDANFLISVEREGSGWVSEKAENYPVVENLFDSATAYNLDFAPARMLKAWAKVLASCVINISDKVLRFTSGNGNYLMNSRRSDELVTLEESGTMDLTEVEPLWDNEIYTFDVPVTRDQMRQIRANPYGYFKFKEIETGPYLEGYLLKAKRASSKLGNFELLKVYRKTDA